jgi:DNA-binding MarR family transcriptional regulator
MSTVTPHSYPHHMSLSPSRPSSPTRSSVPAPQLAAWRALLDAHARTTEVLARELRDEVGLPLPWYDVLLHLNESPDGRLRMQELADKVLLSKSGLTRLVDRMERDGLVTRSACPEDRRGTFADLTSAGKDRLRAAAPTHLRGVREHVADLLDDDEAAVLERLLRRMADAARNAS